MSIQGKCDRLMTFFAPRAEIHSIRDQLWSVAHLPSLSFPSIPPCSCGWHCYSIQAVGTPLSIPKGSRLYQNYFFALRDFSTTDWNWVPWAMQPQRSLPVDLTTWCYQAIQLRSLFFLAPTETTSPVSKLSVGLSQTLFVQSSSPTPSQPWKQPRAEILCKVPCQYLKWAMKIKSTTKIHFFCDRTDQIKVIKPFIP